MSRQPPRSVHGKSARHRTRAVLERLEERSLLTELNLSITSPINEGQTATLTGTITNPPGAAFQVEITWGEGAVETKNLAAGATSFTATHTYADDNPTGTPSDNYAISARLFTPGGTDPTFGFAVQLGGTGPDSAGVGRSVAVDQAGNVYTTGVFTGTVDFDPDPSPLKVFYLTSEGENDIFVTKLDTAGNLVWAKRIGGSGDDQGVALTVDGAGNVYTTGSFSGTVDFNPDPSPVRVFYLTSEKDPSSPVDYPDIFVSKLDTDGNFVWAKRMGGTDTDTGQGVALDGAGNVYTTGSFSGTADFDPDPAPGSLLLDGTLFVTKLDGAGNLVWARALSGPRGEKGVAVDASGNVVITGSFGGTVDFDPDPLRTYALTSETELYSDMFVSKLDTDGNFVWARRMGGEANEYGRSVALDGAGNVYTTGSFWGTVDFDPDPSPLRVFPLTSAGQYDIFVSKLDIDGNFVWARGMGGSIDEEGHGIAVDAFSNVYTTGSFRWDVDFDPNPSPTSKYMLTALKVDVFVSKLDSAGAFSYAVRLGGSDVDEGYGIAVDAASNVITSGYFWRTADFNPHPVLRYDLTSAGETDAFVSKLIAPGSMTPVTAATSVTVLNVAPTVNAGSNANLAVGGTFHRAGSMTDPGTLDTFTATVNYGDGSGDQPLTVNPDRSFTLSRAYPNPGTYTVTITARDDDGGIGPSAFSLRVTAGPIVTRLQTTLKGTALATVQLRFSEPMDTSRVQDVRNYRLVQAGVDRRFGTADDRTASLKTPRYDAASRTVTLTPSVTVAASMPCRITAKALTDVGGILLDGDANGKPGGDYVGVFGPPLWVNRLQPTISGASITAVVLTFSEPLDAARAQNRGNYTLVSAGADGRFGTRDDRGVSLRKATYLSRDRSVTLTPSARLARTFLYRLTVNGNASRGGLLALAGYALDGNRDKVPGGDYVGTFRA